MKHAVITRFKYTSFDEMVSRLNLTKKTLLPNLKNQTNKNFTWVLIINPDHLQYLKENIDMDFIAFKDFDSSFEWIKAEGIHIQSCIDSDDMVSNHYINLIQENAEVYKEQKTLIIHFHVLKFFLGSNKIERRSFQYNKRTISMFYSIYQPEPIIPYYIAPHDQLAKYASLVFSLPIGDAFWVHHDENIHRDPSKRHIIDLKFDDDLPVS